MPVKTGIVLGTSDSFITSAEKQLEGLEIEIDLVDMEGYALKKVCEHHGVQFEAFKFISDDANEEAGEDWKDSVKDGTHLFIQLLEKQFLKSKLL